jgi:protein-S-isoprenylcysteine O-methyltransferase Ste14
MPKVRSVKKRIKINGIVIILGVLGIAFFPHQLIRHSAIFQDDILEIVGVSLILLGQLLRVSARGYKAEQSRSGHQLIQNGPYSMVRNPMYLGIILIGLGTVFFILELWVAVLFAALFLLRYWQLFIKEEKILQGAFGPQYSAYKKSVPRLFPKPGFIFKKDIRNYLPLKLGWFKRESLSILLVLVVCLLIEFREEIKVNGWGALLPEVLVLLAIGGFYFIFVLFLIGRDGKKTE